jgi:hypothetical protein
MFLIMGINQKEKKLFFDQLMICKCCGKYGHVEIFVRYSYFMLFFIPIIKWDKHYYARMNCCGSTCEIDHELGKAIEQGRVSEINEDSLNFAHRESNVRHCAYCGFTTMEDFQFCPKCGREM